MKRTLLVAAAVALGAALIPAEPGIAQVKRVEMDIAGYLCGF